MSRSLGRVQRASLGVLLFAGVLSPVTAAAFGWTAYPAATAAAAAAVSLVLAAVMARASAYRAVVLAAFVAVTLVVATWFAVVLHAEANTFYTSTALFGGMVLMLALHVAAVAMRRVVIRDDDAPRDAPVTALAADRVVAASLGRLPPNEIRVVRAGRATLEPELPDAGWREDATVSVSDALAKGATWLLVLFWGLVALGHRHLASGCILLAGALLGARCLALLPGVLATRGDGSTARA